MSIDVIVYAILSVVSACPHCPAQRWAFWVGGHVRPSHPQATRWAFKHPQHLCSGTTAQDSCPNQKTGVTFMAAPPVPYSQRVTQRMRFSQSYLPV